MIKSASKFFLSSSQQQRNVADRQRRNHIATHPTPGEMLEWLQDVKRGHVLVLVNKTGQAEDARVNDVGRDFTDALEPVRPRGAGAFRRLMRRMLTELVDVPQDGRSAAQSLSDLLASEDAKTQGVVCTDTLVLRLMELNNSLERQRQARRDREGTTLQASE